MHLMKFYSNKRYISVEYLQSEISEAMMDGGQYEIKEIGSIRANTVYEITNNSTGKKNILKMYANADEAKNVCDLTSDLVDEYPSLPIVECEPRGKFIVMPHINGTFFKASFRLKFIKNLNKTNPEDIEIARAVITAFNAAFHAELVDLQGFYSGNGNDTIKFIGAQLSPSKFVLFNAEIFQLAINFNLQSIIENSFKEILEFSASKDWINI